MAATLAPGDWTPVSKLHLIQPLSDTSREEKLKAFRASARVRTPSAPLFDSGPVRSRASRAMLRWPADREVNPRSAPAYREIAWLLSGASRRCPDGGQCGVGYESTPHHSVDFL